MTGTDRYTGVPKIIMNTILAGAAGGLVAAVLKPLVMGTYSKTHRYDVGALANGILGGLVAITAGCAAVQPWAALVIGIIGGIVYSLGCKVLWLIQADDPVEAAAVHGFCGIWGLIALGFFDNTQGLFCGTEKSGKFFGWQMLGMVVIVAWTAATSLIFFFVFKKLGILRV